MAMLTIRRLCLALLCVCCLAFGCTTRFQDDLILLPSWDDSHIAVISEVHRFLELPGHNAEGSGKTIFSVRALDGGRVLQRVVAKNTHYSCLPAVDLAWSPEGLKIALRVAGDLRLLDVAAQEKDYFISGGITAYCWQDASNVVYVTEDSDVYRLSLADKKAEHLFSAKNSSQYVYREYDRPQTERSLSPNGKYWIYFRDESVSFVDLKQNVVMGSFPVGKRLLYHWWNGPAEACLFYASKDEDDDLCHDAFVFNTHERTLKNVSSHLGQLNDRHWNTIPRPAGSAWVSGGPWILVSGNIGGQEPGFGRRDWACCISPWSAVCIQDAIGGDFSRHKASPAQNGISVFRGKMRRDGSGKGDICVTRVLVDSNGDIALSQPVSVVQGEFDDWFWSYDGKKLFTHRNGAFALHDVPGLE